MGAQAGTPASWMADTSFESDCLFSYHSPSTSKEKAVVSFKMFPVKMAWANSAHKEMCLPPNGLHLK